MERPIRVLQVVSGLDIGGVGMMLYNYYKNIDRNIVHFDFITPGEDNGYLESIFTKMGSKVYHITPRRDDFGKHIRELKQILTAEKYDCIHVHQNLTSFISLLYAKKYGIKNRIVHSHEYISQPTVMQKIKRFLLGILNKWYANYYLSCGIDAATWLYGKNYVKKGKVKIVKNGIDVEKFAYNQADRVQIRKQLGIDDKFVLGHVGRMTYEKNHSFMIDVCNELCKINNNIVLLLLGDGKLQKSLSDKVHQMGLTSNIIFIGKCEEVHKYLNAMDVFLLPSLFEAFPLTLIEAQANGLKCIVSETIPRESYISTGICPLPVNKGYSVWVDKIVELLNEDQSRNICEFDNIEKYDIKNLAIILTDFYKSITTNI